MRISFKLTLLLVIALLVGMVGEKAIPVKAASENTTLAGPFTMVATGRYHTCVLRVGGSIACIGDNSYGQAPFGFYSPFEYGTASIFVYIAAGNYDNCAIRTDGHVECWGRNDKGQAPEIRYTTSPYTQLALGDKHTCGLKANGSIDCWGDNSYGQAPAPQTGPYSKITAGANHTCALKTDGSIDCWGDNTFGQAPAHIQNTYYPYTMISAGSMHTCATLATGTPIEYGDQQLSTTQCWGNNMFGQLGSNNMPGLFTQISSLESTICALDSLHVKCWGNNNAGQLHQLNDDNYRQVSVGGYHACAIKSDGTLICWGNNVYGQAPAVANSRYIQVSAGKYFTCWLRLDGALECWGDDEDGRASPPPGVYTQVDAAYFNACGLRENGTMICWGGDSWHQSSWVPAGVVFKQIGAGRMHTCGIKGNNRLACWTDYQYSNTQDPPGGSYREVGGGEDFGCALQWNRSVQCWGSNYDDIDYNYLGQAEDQAGPFNHLAVGYAFSCAIRTDNTLFCWGGNSHYQVSKMPSGTFSQVSAGLYFACAIKTDGTLDCWGSNLVGQTKVPSGIYTSLDAGLMHSCAIMRNGQWQCWGGNDYGQAPRNPAVPSAPEEQDTTSPLVRIVVTPSQPDGANGWYRNPVTLNPQARDLDSEVGDVRCALDPQVVPASFEDLPATPCEYLGGSPVFADGSHTFYAAAEDINGNKSAVISTAFNLDVTAPVISCPETGPILLNSGEQAIGPAGLDASVSGLDAAASTLSGVISTTAVGPQTLSFSATDLAGNSASQACSYNVVYNFGGFYAPLEQAPAFNAAKAGSTIPLKFSLDGDQGLQFLAEGSPMVQPVNCKTGQSLGDPSAASVSGLSYDPQTGWYNLTWKTEKAFAGSCQEMLLTLNDGTQHPAYFKFK